MEVSIEMELSTRLGDGPQANRLIDNAKRVQAHWAQNRNLFLRHHPTPSTSRLRGNPTSPIPFFDTRHSVNESQDGTYTYTHTNTHSLLHTLISRKRAREHARSVERETKMVARDQHWRASPQGWNEAYLATHSHLQFIRPMPRHHALKHH